MIRVVAVGSVDEIIRRVGGDTSALPPWLELLIREQILTCLPRENGVACVIEYRADPLHFAIKITAEPTLDDLTVGAPW